MSEMPNQITVMDMNNLRVIPTLLTILFLCPDVLSARRFPHELYQTTATKEDEDFLELVLQNKEEMVNCVGIDLHSDYCLALKPSSTLSESRSFKAYLNQNIVRNCSSSGICTDHGALYKHTRLQEASEGCEGIPFANIHKNLTGKYTVIIDQPPKHLKASFNLTFCKGGKSNDAESLKGNLEFKGDAKDCVSQSDHDSFCLQLRFGDQPLKDKAFRCFLQNELIYGCSANGSCTAHGILQGNVRPSYANEDCSGIPFSNVIPTAVGRYSCEVEDETRLIEDEFHLHFCNGTRTSNNTEAQAEETLEKHPTNKSHISMPVVITIAVLASAACIVCIVCIARTCHRRRAPENANQPQEELNESRVPLDPER